MEKTQKPVFGISTAAQYEQSTKKKQYTVKNILTSIFLFLGRTVDTSVPVYVGRWVLNIVLNE